MSHPQILGIIHLLVLIYLSWKVANAWVFGMSRQMCATGILVWGNLVCTSLSLSLFHRLNSVIGYEFVSISFAVLLWLVGTHTTPEARDPLPRTPRVRGEFWLRVVFAVALVISAAATLYILFTHVPSNWDASTYRFPRAIWYLNSGSLLHFAASPDPRMTFYPFNGTILYIFATLYQFGETGYELISFLGWCAGGLGVFTVAKQLGGTTTGSIFATFLALLTPNVLTQAASANDEVLAASALLLTLPFVHDWFRNPQHRFAFLGGVGIGIAVGVKLHWAFYYPYLLLAGGVSALWLLRHRERWLHQIKVRSVGLAIALAPMIIFGMSFLVSNWISTRTLTASAFNDQVMNKPFSGLIAREKIQAGTGQLMLSPIPDLLRRGSPEEVAQLYNNYNRTTDRLFFSNISEIRKLSIEGYRFTGPLADGTDPAGMMEYTVWAGFIPWLILASALLAGFGTGVSRPALWLVLSLFGWHLAYAIHTKYIGGVSAYYAYPSIIACAGLGAFWDWSCSQRTLRRRLLLGLFLLTAITHVILAKNLFFYNRMRNVVYAWNKAPATDMHTGDPALAETVRLSQHIHIPYTHWAQLAWHLMRPNPAATFSTGPVRHDLAPGETQLIGCAPVGSRGLIAVALPTSVSASATFIGRTLGDRYYATGIIPASLYPRRGGLAIVPVSIPGDLAHPAKTLRLEGPWIGVKASDAVEFRPSLMSAETNRIFSGTWVSTSQGTSLPEIRGFEVPDTLLIDVRLSGKPGEFIRSYIPLSALSAIRPAKVERIVAEDGKPANIEPALSSVDVSPEPAGPKTARFELGGAKSLPVKVVAEGGTNIGTSFDKRDYVVRWLKQSTQLEAENLNDHRAGEFAIKLCRGGATKPRTIRLRVNGVVSPTVGRVSKMLWIDGMDELRFPVSLIKGTNKFEVFTPEPVDYIDSVQKACCLLVGDPVVILKK